MKTFEKLVIPPGWIKTCLSEVLPLNYGKGLAEKYRDSEGKVPVFGSSGLIGHHSLPMTSGPTLIVGRKGSVGEVHYSPIACWPIDTTYFVELKTKINLRFFFYLLKKINLGRLDKSTAVPGLSRDDYNKIEVAIAPFAEQQRIVAEIEKQFTRLDAAVDALKRVKVNLKRYRSSVLKVACEGRLVPTEAELANKEGRSYEPADVLLKRILKERRAKWEADQLAQMKAKGKSPKNEKWKEKYKEPVQLNTVGLPTLPESWIWVTLAAISDIKGGLAKGKKRRAGDKIRPVPYLRVANVQRGFLDLTKIKEIKATEDEIRELKLLPGDILFNEGGDRDKLGRGWIWQDEISQCIHQNHVFRARIYLKGIQSKFISWYGNSIGQKYFLIQGKQTTNLASINLTKLSVFPVPMPPLEEQFRIVAEIDRQLSFIDELETIVDQNLKRAERLQQAILKSAFEGKLVSQDPNDEPASVLLGNIRKYYNEENKNNCVTKNIRKNFIIRNI